MRTLKILKQFFKQKFKELFEILTFGWYDSGRYIPETIFNFIIAIAYGPIAIWIYKNIVRVVFEYIIKYAQKDDFDWAACYIFGIIVVAVLWMIITLCFYLIREIIDWVIINWKQATKEIDKK